MCDAEEAIAAEGSQPKWPCHILMRQKMCVDVVVQSNLNVVPSNLNVVGNAFT